MTGSYFGIYVVKYQLKFTQANGHPPNKLINRQKRKSYNAGAKQQASSSERQPP